MVEEDKVIQEQVDLMIQSDEYRDFQKYLSEFFFDYSEDYFTSNLYEKGTARQHIDEEYAHRLA